MEKNMFSFSCVCVSLYIRKYLHWIMVYFYYVFCVFGWSCAIHTSCLSISLSFCLCMIFCSSSKSITLLLLLFWRLVQFSLDAYSSHTWYCDRVRALRNHLRWTVCWFVWNIWNSLHSHSSKDELPISNTPELILQLERRTERETRIIKILFMPNQH